ncbi:MAG: hypothetical protein KatS3mg087_0419 [Patescibacteria group bacterium]|nr:MAG: hypothetical protein KatS3mg087_0419 [Patescibacteria group bacterium]
MENINVLIEKIDALIKINERLEWLLANRLAAKTVRNETATSDSPNPQQPSTVSEVRVVNAVPTVVTQQPIQVSPVQPFPVEASILAGTDRPDSSLNDPSKYLIVRLTNGTEFINRDYLYAWFDVTTNNQTIITGQPGKKIRVYSLIINTENIPVWRFEDTGGTALTGYLSLTGMAVLTASFIGGLFETGTGQGLNIVSSTFPLGSRIAGVLTYAFV